MKGGTSCVLHFFGVLISIVSFAEATLSYGGEFIKDIEKDYGLRSIGSLQITNPKGDITVQGWALDKIRVKLRKRANADTAEKAIPLFNRADYRYQVSDKNIEISIQYGNDLDLVQRLHEFDHPDIHTDLTVYAPSNLKLNIWSIGGKVVLKAWNASASIRSGTGTVRVEGVKADDFELACPSCPAQLRNIRASVRCSVGSGSTEMAHIHGKSIFVETDSGTIKLFQVQGEQLYISKTGSIEGQFLRGKVEFSVQQGTVDLREISGFLSGSIEAGNVVAKIRDWEFWDKALIESGTGNIELTLPQRFSGDVDIWSLHGKTETDFTIQKSQELATFGPEPINHLVGRIREGGELLKIYTDSGNIQVKKGSKQ